MNKHNKLDSALIALIYGAKDLVIDIEEDHGFHAKSLALRVGDLRALFNEAVSIIEQINEDIEVQQD